MTITISKDVLAQELDGETVLLDLSGERFFGLDEVSTRIWQLLGEGADEAAIVDRLLEEYDVGRGGGFVRLDVQKLEVTLSGGFTGDYLMEDPSGYISLGVYRAF